MEKQSDSQLQHHKEGVNWHLAKDQISKKHKRPPIELELMMFGKKKVSRLVFDEDGNKIITHYSKMGNPVYKKKNVYVSESKYNGDTGIFPSVNAVYRKGRYAMKEYTSMASSKFEEWQSVIGGWAIEENWEVKNEKIIMDIFLTYPNDNRIRDSHNILKMLIDTMSPSIAKSDHLILPRIQDFRKVQEGEDPSIFIYLSYADEYYD